MNWIRHIISLFTPDNVCYPSYVDKLEDLLEQLKATEDYNIELQCSEDVLNKGMKEHYYEDIRNRILTDIINVANEATDS